MARKPRKQIAKAKELHGRARDKLENLKKLLGKPGHMGVIPIYEALVGMIGEDALWETYLTRAERRKLARRRLRWAKEQQQLVAA